MKHDGGNHLNLWTCCRTSYSLWVELQPKKHHVHHRVMGVAAKHLRKMQDALLTGKHSLNLDTYNPRHTYRGTTCKCSHIQTISMIVSPYRSSSQTWYTRIIKHTLLKSSQSNSGTWMRRFHLPQFWQKHWSNGLRVNKSARIANCSRICKCPLNNGIFASKPKATGP